ncbi:hypothetical protein [Massilia sp. S19_KUP03_FR1]|uniref:hypothetical protein n=1 Tax=Massilia sp. S19_KUP03_FR1 TaxID=3025503 RepID=UPI002FCD791F
MGSKGKKFRPVAQRPGFENDYENEWEEIALWWNTRPSLAAEIAHFFDEYVHDSRAWFKLIPGNPDNEADMIALLKKWDTKRMQALNDNAEFYRRFALTHGDAAAQRARQKTPCPVAKDGLSDEQRTAAQEYARTQKIPTMTTSGREPFEAYYISSRGGYLRYRKIYGGWDSVLISRNDSADGDQENVA